MPCDEISKAIQWSNKSNTQEFFPIRAYLTLHNGVKSQEPIDSVEEDQVWYATGGVEAVESPTPHLSGTLTDVWTTSNGVLQSKPKLDVKIKVFADGTVSLQKLLDGKPIGGMLPSTFSATCVDNDLLTGLDGGQVVTIGVARSPSEPTGPK